MTPFLPILQHLVVGNMMGPRPTPRFSSADVILRTMSFVFLLVGLFLAIYAEYMWLGIFLPFYLASLVTGLTLIALSLLLMAIRHFLKTKRHDTQHTPPVDLVTMLTEIVSSLDQDLEGVIRENPKVSVLLSTLGGLMAGRKINNL